MAWARFGEDTRSVSDVIGTVLLLGITTALFSVFSVAVLDQLDRNPPPSNVEFRVDSNDERTTIVHVWGESLDVDDLRLFYEKGALPRLPYMLSDLPDWSLVHRPGGLDTRWDLGEALRLGCPASEGPDGCAYPGETVANITVTQTTSNAVLFSSEPGVTPGSLVNPAPDLVVGIQGVDDPNLDPPPLGTDIDSDSAVCPAANDDLYVLGSVVLAATISNAGIIPTPTGSTLTVSFYWDGDPVPLSPSDPSATRSQFLAAGESFTARSREVAASSAGSHSIRVEVTASPAFTEATLLNNKATKAFDIVTGTCDPGQPYEDGDGDLLYNPYPHPDPLLNDLLVATADVTDGVYMAGPGKNLVIPASVGTIKPGVTIDFQAPGDLIIGVTLEHVVSPYEIRLTAGRHFNFTGSVEVRGRDYISITAGGTLDISDALFDSQSDDVISISTNGGPLIAFGTQFYIDGLWGSPPGDVVLTASHATLGYIDIRGARFDVDAGTDTLGKIDVGAATNVYAQNAQIDAQVRLDLRATQTIRLEGAILRSGFIVLNYDLSAPNLVYVDGATIDDTDACADTEPILLNDAEVLGTTASGRVERGGPGNQC